MIRQGLRVQFYPPMHDGARHEPGKPLAGLIAYVTGSLDENGREVVNLVIFDAFGVPGQRPNVPIIPEREAAQATAPYAVLDPIDAAAQRSLLAAM